MHHLVEEYATQSKIILDTLKKELSGVRANRPSTALIEDFRVNYYGQILPMKQVGSLSVAPPREIIIHVWDKEAVGAVTKAIEASSLNLTASVEGMYIRIKLPELSEERREELIKHVRRVSEEFRIEVRHVRDEVNKKIQNASDDGMVNEDQKFKLKEEVQKLVDGTNADIERMLESKIAEIKL